MYSQSVNTNNIATTIKSTSIESMVESKVQNYKVLSDSKSNNYLSSLEIEGFDLNSNSTVLDVNASDIDLEDVKEQLEEKYHENPKNKSFGDTDEINLPKINLDETREYDINTIFEPRRNDICQRNALKSSQARDLERSRFLKE